MKRSQVTTHSPFDSPNVAPHGLAMLALDDVGVIQRCDRNCEQAFGYRQDELRGHHVAMLLPELEDMDLVLEDRLNLRLAFLCHCAIPFQARYRDGRYFSSELFISRLGSHNVVVLVRSLEVQIPNMAQATAKPVGVGRHPYFFE